MRTRNLVLLAVIVLLVLINWNTIQESLKEEPTTGQTTKIIEVPEEIKTDKEAYFCPQDECARQLIEWIKLSKKKVHCAFYDVDLDEVKNTLEMKKEEGVDVLVVIDADNYEFWENTSWVRNDTRTAIMHNKFCVIDNQAVWTGSFNPTHRGNENNNNNAILYQSKYLAENYEDEFQELWNGVFGKGLGVKNPTVIVDGKKIENYFCPEDWCANKVIYALQEANKSIYFMTFSFTHDGIGDEIISKSKEGVEIKGVFEKSQNNKWSEYQKMKDTGIDVRWDGNRANMHHKVFIIDNRTVITGSFNPSRNGDERNDENVLIIHDAEMAERFLEEFERVWQAAEQ